MRSSYGRLVARFASRGSGGSGDGGGSGSRGSDLSQRSDVYDEMATALKALENAAATMNTHLGLLQVRNEGPSQEKDGRHFDLFLSSCHYP